MKEQNSIQKIVVLVLSLICFLSFRDTFAQPVISLSTTNDAYSTTQTKAVKKITLEQLIIQALDNNPEIKMMQRSFDMMQARVLQAKAWPEPMLSLGYLGNIIPIPPFDIQKGDPSSARILQFSQEIPFPGKLALKGKMATKEAEAEWWVYQQARLDLIAEVKENYFELWYLNKAINIVSKNRDLLEKFTKITEAKYAVGKGLQQDILKAQVEISKLTEQLTVLEQQREVAASKINNLLYQDLAIGLEITEELNPSEFSHTLAGLNEIALSSSPVLKMQKRKIDREQYNFQLAQKEFYPDFTVSFTYQNRPNMPEMYGVNIGVKLPIYFWQKQRPALTEAFAGLSKERKRLDSTTVNLLLKIKEKYLLITTSQKLIKLYGKVIIPQSSLSFESAISSYETGKVDFLTLIDGLSTLLNYELNYYEQVSNMEKAIAALEPLVGNTLHP
ncbi:MAG: outer membrane efflux protein [bacterium]|nr:MAG: outer membrane efflux protein [bacterium]